MVSLCVGILAGCTKRRVLEGLSHLIRFLEMVKVFYFLLAYFIILILYTTDFNSKINEDIIIIIIIISISIIIIIDVKTSRFVFTRSDYFISFNEIDIKVTLKK